MRLLWKRVGLSILLGIVAIPASGEEPKPISWTAYDGFRGGIFYRPTDFFRHGLKQSFPEMEAINSEKIPLLGTMAKHLEAVGVPVLYGFDPNVEATFDLYGQVLNVTPFLPRENIGVSPKTDIGRFYMPEHDTGHHFAGIPGLRRSDLADLAATKRKLVKIILLKEAFAVNQSSMVFLPAYGEWRDRANIPAGQLETYRRYNQGYFSGLRPMTPAEHVAINEAWTLGDTAGYHRLLNSLASAKSLADTKKAGVTPMMPDFSKYVGEKLNNALLAWIVKTFEAKLSRKRTVGYEGFLKYANVLADFYLQPWLVEWSDDFQVGFPLAELETRTKNLIEQARAGNFMNLVDPAANSAHALDWERAFLKTEISLFGRRVREALVTLEADGKKRSAVYADLEGIYRRAVASHRAITPGSDLSSAKRGFLDLVELAEKVAPVAKTFSWSNRARSVRYTDYWRDPYAYMVERDSLGGSHLSETETKDAFAKALERKSRFARWQERVKKKFVPGYESAAERQKLKAELARRYESGKLGSWEQVAEPMTDKTLRGQSDLFRKNFRRLIQGALLPQFPEIEPLDRKTKLLVEQELNALVATLDEKLFQATRFGKTLDYPVWQAIDQALFAIHARWLANEAPTETRALSEITTLLQRAVDQTKGARFVPFSSLVRSSPLRTFTPPGFGSPENTLLFVDFVRPHFAPAGVPARSAVTPYIAFQDWIHSRTVVDCVRYLKQPEPGHFKGNFE